MPKYIIIENLFVDDSNNKNNDKGPFIFKDFNPKFINESYQETFPYIKTKEVILKSITTASGKKLKISDNKYIFKDVKLVSD